MEDLGKKLGIAGLVQTAAESYRCMCLWHITFCKRQGCTADKAAVVFELLREHHRASVEEPLDFDASLQHFHNAVLAASAKDAPGPRLTLQDIKALISYYVSTYLRHYQ
eukprot:COSAG05_NODE_15690_length_364_cov_0.430189_1_plen_108_part_01